MAIQESPMVREVALKLSDCKENPPRDPTLFEFGKIGKLDLGYITVAENSELPFPVKRVYWTYYTPDSVIRGYHAHLRLNQLIFAVSGEINFRLESIDGREYRFVLNRPYLGLYIPPGDWREIKLSHNAVLLCLASLEYDETDYIRDYEDFRSLGADLKSHETTPQAIK